MGGFLLVLPGAARLLRGDRRMRVLNKTQTSFCLNTLRIEPKSAAARGTV